MKMHGNFQPKVFDCKKKQHIFLLGHIRVPALSNAENLKYWNMGAVFLVENWELGQNAF